MPKLSPDDVANRAFATSFRGYAEAEVRSFLKRVSEELTALREREHELLAAVDDLESRLAAPRPLDEKELLDALGEETTRLLRNAREAADDIRQRSEERASQIIEEAQADAQRMRHEAAEILGVRTREAEEAAAELQRQTENHVNELRSNAERHFEEQRLRAENEATGIVEGARTQGREMVEEAKALRERVLADLARRRGLLQAQLEELRNGRDHLLDAYRVVKRTFLEATESLAQAEARAAAGKPLPSVDPADVDAAIAAENASEDTPTNATEEATVAVEVTEVVTDVAGDVVAIVDDAAVVEVVAEGGAGAPGTDADGGEAPALADVDSLFARIRAGAEPGAEPEPVVPEATDAGPPDAAEAAETGAETADAPAAEEPAPAGNDARAAWRAQQRDVVGPLVGPLVKQAKRAAQDEQNTLLDALRRYKGRPTAQQVLQSDLDTITAWSNVMRSALDSAYGAGRVAVGGDQVAAPPDLAEEAVRHVVMDLRERLATAVDDDNDGYSTSLVIERIGARYREWKLQSLEGLVEDVLTSAWSRGVFDAVPDGARLQWVPSEEGRCADCDDNALEPTVKGETFPTGQLHPPAHPGCRCILAVA